MTHGSEPMNHGLRHVSHTPQPTNHWFYHMKNGSRRVVLINASSIQPALSFESCSVGCRKSPLLVPLVPRHLARFIRRYQEAQPQPFLLQLQKIGEPILHFLGRGKRRRGSVYRCWSLRGQWLHRRKMVWGAERYRTIPKGFRGHPRRVELCGQQGLWRDRSALETTVDSQGVGYYTYCF